MVSNSASSVAVAHCHHAMGRKRIGTAAWVPGRPGPTVSREPHPRPESPAASRFVRVAATSIRIAASY
jgi:hypothetical protein